MAPDDTKRRLPMAADTDPTDEELVIFMREALDGALQRKVVSDAWMRDELLKAVSEAKERDAKWRKK